ncbi:MAG: ATP-binding protein [Gammaproteobacteria bacterium]
MSPWLDGIPASVPEDLRDAYLDLDYQARVRLMRFSMILYMILNPTFLGLDWLVYPDAIAALTTIRLTFDVLFGVLLAVSFTSVVRYARLLGVIAALLGSASIAALVLVTEGAASPYYAGLNLVIVVMFVLLPWTLVETLVVCVGTILIYSTACALHATGAPGQGANWADFANNLFFIGSTSIICIIASHYQSGRRFETFRLNYELDERNRELSELDRLKSDFFANVSHELRTPLTLILAPVQHLLELGGQLPDRVAEPLGIIRGNALRLLKMVNELLDVLRLQEGKSQLRMQAQELHGLIDGITDSMVHLSDTQQISLVRHRGDAPLLIHADSGALEKIAINVIGNAIKFSEPGGEVTIVTRLDEPWAVLEVRDQGIGIPKDLIPHVFDRFRQADGSTTRRHQGTGLGLALVKELVEQHNGEVRVNSEPGAGTTLRVRLPLMSDLQVETEQQQTDHAPMERDMNEGMTGLEGFHRAAALQGGLTPDRPEEIEYWDDGDGADDLPLVLVVDDEPDMRQYLTEVLTEDYHVITARDGQHALDQAARHKPDLILLDLMLPHVDGLEVCRRLKKNPTPVHQKIMLLTARADEQSKLTALRNGADDFLIKPFSTVEVRTRLGNLFENARLERELSERNERLTETLNELKSTQSQLVHSEKLNALGNLAAGLLHEINNPLNYTRTALQLTQSDPTVKNDPMLSEMIGDMNEGLGRIAGIVTDLRAFAYPSDAEKGDRFPMSEPLNTAMNFTAHALKTITVDVGDIPTDEVEGSRNHLVQVLVNLLTNAGKAIDERADAGEEDPGLIRVRGHVTDGLVVVEVSDNGTGMDEQTASRVFDPFFTTRDVGEGMGLGLSVVHTIVQNHGGRIEVRSRLGEGTTFSLALPRADAAGGADSADTQPTAGKPAERDA